MRENPSHAAWIGTITTNCASLTVTLGKTG